MSGLPRLHGTDECTQKLAVNLRRKGIHINILSPEKLTSIFDLIDPRRFKFNLLESNRRQLASVFAFLHRTSDTADPRKHALTNLKRHFATGDDIRDRESASGL
jgi:hypothetical protein